jgi:hypothetical protein
MPSPASLRSKIDSALRKAGPPLRTVYLRKITVAGDVLIGRQTATPTDKKLTPQPIYRQLGQEQTLSNGSIVYAGDYKFTASATAITLTDLKDKSAQLVLKAADGTTEVLRIVYYVPASMQGEAVAFTIFAQGVRRA